MSSSSVVQFYRTVIEDVVTNVRETFLDDGIDEQVLMELKQIWESKISQSKAIPSESEPVVRESDAALKNARAQAATSVVTIAASVSSAGTTAPNVQYNYTTAAGAAGQSGDDAPKTVTITLPSQTSAAGQKPVTITLPAHLVQNSQAGGIIMSASTAAAAQALPPGIAAGLLQSQLTRVITQQQPDGTTVSYQTMTAEQLAKRGYVVSMVPKPGQGPAASSSSTTTPAAAHNSTNNVIQLDGADDTSDDDDDDDELRDEEDPDDDDDKNDNEGVVEEEVDSDPLNTDDDVSDEDPSELFDTDNVIVCQYDKITRSRNKWKFHLKDGIMNLQGKDYIFQKAIGDAEW